MSTQGRKEATASVSEASSSAFWPGWRCDVRRRGGGADAGRLGAEAGRVGAEAGRVGPWDLVARAVGGALMPANVGRVAAAGPGRAG